MAPENKNDIAHIASNVSNVPHQATLTEETPKTVLPLAGQFITPTIMPAEKKIDANQAIPHPDTLPFSTPTQFSQVQQPRETPFLSLKRRIKRINFKKAAAVAVLVVFFSVSTVGAYLLGKNDQKIVFQEHPTQPLNLPPQAVVVAKCVKGRGKQYVLPKDIPGGPIYDVVNDKVVAIEYNLNVSELITNSDNFSNTILRLAKDYPIDHLSLIPILPKNGGQVENALLVTFVVSKDEAKAITCDTTGA